MALRPPGAGVIARIRMPAFAEIIEWAATLHGIELLFAITAAAGSLVFLFRIVMSLFFGDLDVDVDADFDLDGGGDGGFSLLSIQGLSSFFMMFGFVGLAVSYTGFSTLASVAAAFFSGAGALLLVGWITSSMYRLQSSGNVQVKNAIGSQGTVYLTIPKGGTGSVQINVQNRLRTMDAVAADKKEIKTGQGIKVVEVRGDDILIVEKD